MRVVEITISDPEWIKMNTIPNKETAIVREKSPFVDLMKTALDLAIVFQEKHNKQFVATWIVNIVKDMLRPHFLKK